jgi:uroporphyrinogen decarboxylase
MGLDALNPLEVKAGVEPCRFKADYGDKLVLHGGLNAVLWEEPEKLHEEMGRVIPALKQSGGYICSTDHSVPANVSLEDFRQFTALAKELGAY